MEGRAAQADFCFVHFTDTHIIAGGTLHNFDTSASLQRVIAVLNALEPRPAFAVIGGDLVSPDIVDRNRRGSLQLIRIQNDLNALALAMRDLLDNPDHYPVVAWKAPLASLVSPLGA